LIDLHLHTTASDGTLAPADLVARAAAAGITTLSVTDHDTVAGHRAAREAAARFGVTFVAGIEITAVENRRDVHVLGYFLDAADARLTAFLTAQREDRVRRVREIARRLADTGCPIDVAPLLDAARSQPGRSIGRPQLAYALVAAGFARDRDDAFERLLGDDSPAFVPRCGAPPEEVMALLAGAGGIASLAHPALLDNDSIIPRLAANGLPAIEVFHSDHDAKKTSHYRALARTLGLAASGGSDFHGDGVHRNAFLGSATLPPDEFEALQARRR
jgi:hypothetical protein